MARSLWKFLLEVSLLSPPQYAELNLIAQWLDIANGITFFMRIKSVRPSGGTQASAN
jgi:hypothetical protein